VVEATIVIRMPRARTEVWQVTCDSEAGLRNWIGDLERDAKKAYTEQRYGAGPVMKLDPVDQSRAKI
jgi:hypothetical protein